MVLVLIMIWLGGFTRLTGAGLSITEWKPVTGIFPPITEADWNGEMHKYENTPEYKHFNEGISIEEFKKIYLTEYFHRLLGRLIGIFFLLPLIYFWIKGYLQTREKAMFVGIFFLGLLQGLVGWIMVHSGLIDMPYVNHIKLTMHLVLGLLITILLWIMYLRVRYEEYEYSSGVLGYIILGSVILQISLGGMLAGLKGGLIYNTFPLMDGYIIPKNIEWFNFSDVIFIQFIHRWMAKFVFLLGVFNVLLYSERWRSFILICMQCVVGILTLIWVVPIYLASLHQVIAFLIVIMLVRELIIYKK